MKACALLLSLLLTLAGCPAWAEGELVSGPDRRSEIDLRIEALDAERAEISTRGPKTATYVGAGLMGVGFPVVLGSLLACSGCFENEQPNYGAVYAGVALFSIGFFTTITSGIVWGVRAKRRNEIDAERDSLIEERDGLAAVLSRLELCSPHRDGAQFVTLGLRF